MGRYKWGYKSRNIEFIGLIGFIEFRVYMCGYKSPNMGHNYSHLTYSPTYNYP